MRNSLKKLWVYIFLLFNRHALNCHSNLSLIFCSSSKSMKMDAYNTAVLSYALATAANKQRPGLLGLPTNPNILCRNDQLSLTPPTRMLNNKMEDEDNESRNTFYRALCRIEHNIVNKTLVHFQQLMELCLLRQVSFTLARFKSEILECEF